MLSFGIAFWRDALASPAIVGLGPYGPLGQPDIYGIRLPGGFRARLLGRAGRVVTGTDYPWHGEPDGGATFRTKDGGWVYTSNSELPGEQGGAGALRFSADGRVVDAYRILDGTLYNCAGAATPWGTWLSCEEFSHGRVWECDPEKPGQGVVRPGLGAFAHEAAAVDPRTGWVYLAEDDYDGRLYRFRPDEYGDLSTGILEAAKVRRSGHVDWVEVSTKRPERSDATTGFLRGDEAWFADRCLFFTTTADHRVWAMDVETNEIEVLYDGEEAGRRRPAARPRQHHRARTLRRHLRRRARRRRPAAADARGRPTSPGCRSLPAAGWPPHAARSPALRSALTGRASTSARSRGPTARG